MTGTVSGPVNVPAQTTSSPVSGFSFSSTTVGANQTGSFTLSDSNATGSPATGSVSVNVYDHASPSISGTTIALPDTIVGFNGGTSTLGGITVSNAAGYRSNLKTTGATTAGPYVGIANVSGIAPGGSDTISAAAVLDGTQPVGLGALNQTFTLTYADDSTLSGASANLGTVNITVTGNVLAHASPTFSSAANRVMISSSSAVATATLGDAAAPAEAGLQITSLPAGLSGASVNQVIANGGSVTLSAPVGSTATTGPYSQTYVIGVSDDQSILGWTSSGTQNFTISGAVVANRVVTATPVSFGIVHAGQSASSSTTLSTAGGNNYYTAVTVPGGSDSLVTVQGTSTVFNSDGQSETRPVSGTFPTAGVIGNTISLATVGEGLAGEQPIPVQVNYTATVFSGSASWTGASGSSWGTNGSWQDTQAAGAQRHRVSLPAIATRPCWTTRRAATARLLWTGPRRSSARWC